MDLKLRPEHWILLAILALCVVLLALQMGQSWSFPALAHLTQVIDESSPDPTPGTSSSPQADPASGGDPQEKAEEGPDEPEAGTEQQEAGSPPAETRAPEPASGVEDLSDAETLFDLMVLPDSIAVSDAMGVVVLLRTTESPVEAAFELIYDATILEPVPDGHQALEALATERTLPEISIDAGESGRLKIRIRKQGTSSQPAPENAQLCALQFKPLRSAETSVRVTRGVLGLSDGKQLHSGESQKMFQIH